MKVSVDDFFVIGRRTGIISDSCISFEMERYSALNVEDITFDPRDRKAGRCYTVHGISKMERRVGWKRKFFNREDGTAGF